MACLSDLDDIFYPPLESLVLLAVPDNWEIQDLYQQHSVGDIIALPLLFHCHPCHRSRDGHTFEKSLKRKQSKKGLTFPDILHLLSQADQRHRHL